MELSIIRRIEKPWGEEHILAQTDNYIVKILVIKKHHRLSKQYHVKKDETLWLLEGNAFVEFNGDQKGYVLFNLRKGEPRRICPKEVHRISAREDTKILEVSSGEIDDVIRLEDDYERA